MYAQYINSSIKSHDYFYLKYCYTKKVKFGDKEGQITWYFF